MENTVVGVLLGFVLAQVALVVRSAQAKRQLDEATRTLIRCEITSNKQMLADHWLGILADSNKWRDGEGAPDYFHLANRVIRFAFPPLSKQGWIASFDKIPSAYGKAQIEGLWETYKTFDHLRALHDSIMQRSQEANASRRSLEASDNILSPMAPFISAQEFGDSAAHLAESYTENMRSILGDQFTEIPEG